jgi:hypothetical protein
MGSMQDNIITTGTSLTASMQSLVLLPLTDDSVLVENFEELMKNNRTRMTAVNAYELVTGSETILNYLGTKAGVSAIPGGMYRFGYAGDMVRATKIAKLLIMEEPGFEDALGIAADDKSFRMKKRQFVQARMDELSQIHFRALTSFVERRRTMYRIVAQAVGSCPRGLELVRAKEDEPSEDYLRFTEGGTAYADVAALVVSLAATSLAPAPVSRSLFPDSPAPAPYQSARSLSAVMKTGGAGSSTGAGSGSGAGLGSGAGRGSLAPKRISAPVASAASPSSPPTFCDEQLQYLQVLVPDVTDWVNCPYRLFAAATKLFGVITHARIFKLYQAAHE